MTDILASVVKNIKYEFFFGEGGIKFRSLIKNKFWKLCHIAIPSSFIRKLTHLHQVFETYLLAIYSTTAFHIVRFAL